MFYCLEKGGPIKENDTPRVPQPFWKLDAIIPNTLGKTGFKGTAGMVKQKLGYNDEDEDKIKNHRLVV